MRTHGGMQAYRKRGRAVPAVESRLAARPPAGAAAACCLLLLLLLVLLSPLWICGTLQRHHSVNILGSETETLELQRPSASSTLVRYR